MPSSNTVETVGKFVKNLKNYKMNVETQGYSVKHEIVSHNTVYKFYFTEHTCKDDNVT